MDKNVSSKSVNSNIVLFPEFVTLQGEVEKLRTELSMLLLERDELLFVECKNIEMVYMLALGNLEYKAYEIHCAVLRLKRKLELIQAKKNRQEKVVIAAIEKILDEEFAAYKEQMDEQINKMNAALNRSHGEALSATDAAELKKLYRAVVKSLHPDLHPHNSEAQAALFNNAVAAYENGDLNSLRIISSMVAEPELPENRESSIKVLVREKERLIKLLQVIRDSIEEIKNSYPYTMKSLVNDEEQLAKKKAELTAVISQLKEVLDFYKAKLAEM